MKDINKCVSGHSCSLIRERMIPILQNLFQVFSTYAFFFFYLVKMPKRGNSFHNGIERSIIYSGLAFSKLSTDASTVFH